MLIFFVYLNLWFYYKGKYCNGILIDRFVENEETINLHLGELDSRLQSLDEEIEEKRDESRGFSKQHSSCTSAISKIEHLQERCRR